MAFEKRDFIVETLATINDPLKNALVPHIVDTIELHYREPQRFYHTTRHIDELFTTLETHQQAVRNPRVVGWAILFHDVVYNPTVTGGQNEERSAVMAETMQPCAMKSYDIPVVARYVRATAKHDPASNDPDLDFFLDADVAILGADPERYDEYAIDIRKEYAHVHDEAYRYGRANVLTDLATRAGERGLFVTDLFNDLYGDAAKENIARELDSLK